MGSQTAGSGIHVAEQRARTLSASPSSEQEEREEAARKMKQVRAIMLAVLVGAMVPVGAFAQKGGNDNRPPKDNPKIVEKEKPPPSNSNKKGRP